MLEDLDIHEDAENQSPNAGLIGTPLKRSKMFEEPQVGELKLFSADETLRFVLNPKLDQPASDEKASSMIVQTLASVPNDSSASVRPVAFATCMSYVLHGSPVDRDAMYRPSIPPMDSLCFLDLKYTC
jgi:hypothetical protein